MSVFLNPNDPNDMEFLRYAKSSSVEHRSHAAQFCDIYTQLPFFVRDESPIVRMIAADRLDPSDLYQMQNDDNVTVLCRVIRRIDKSFLANILQSPKAIHIQVRVAVYKRLAPTEFLNYIHTEDSLQGREMIAQRLAIEYVPLMLTLDENSGAGYSYIRQILKERLIDENA